MPAQLSLHAVSKSFGDRTVLDRVDLSLRPGEKAGVVGENGSGKSTLLRLIAGGTAPDEGEITVAFPGGVGHLAQTLALPGNLTVQDAVDHALADLRALEAALRTAEENLTEATLDAYGELLAAYQDRGGYEADARVEAALHNLGLARITRDRALGSLSGGEQSRLALACVLAADPELLLLDEPTNHLDRHATAWLEDRLRTHRGTVVAVTHDRAFLERVTDTVWEVDRDLRTVTRYGDGWQGYRTAKAAARARWAQEHQQWADELAHTEALVEAAGQRLAATGKDPGQGFGKHRRSSEAKLSGRVRAARQRLETLRANPVPAPPVPLSFHVKLRTTDDEQPATVAELRDIRVADRLHLPELTIKSGERLLVSGPNGAGKSTLLRVLAGEIAPDAGTVVRPDHLGHLHQEPDRSEDRRTLLAGFAAGRPGFPEEYEEELLALGLFRPDDLGVPVAALSVGQRRRLELARLVTRPADLLVLDEPTNHISLALVEELEEALAAYPGAVVVVSHDRRFRSGFAGAELELAEGRVVSAG
ncbi:ABC transporter ATP-binding protein [Streptomyces spiroverticillatus]|uniref:ABC transporter ATP-binding protein n=1 Tax=Streptomyces finlayi TaxID=67296 RepID=A0A919C7N9_9ACTN|nr:ABC-F family ATP-binding cassette domain-containing protein [Streptomyces finlayi]GGZ89327.1 ABC transporter ATP-binding protein [Streptomyces spiroverticillatus]GHC80211.1 ABC transporter ATP-binding protein [Streptomyces finlayi]